MSADLPEEWQALQQACSTAQVIVSFNETGLELSAVCIVVRANSRQDRCASLLSGCWRSADHHAVPFNPEKAWFTGFLPSRPQAASVKPQCGAFKLFLEAITD